LIIAIRDFHALRKEENSEEEGVGIGQVDGKQFPVCFFAREYWRKRLVSENAT